MRAFRFLREMSAVRFTMGLLADVMFGAGATRVTSIGQALRVGINLDSNVKLRGRHRASLEVRSAAYASFQRAAIDAALASQLVRSMVPGIKGGLWTIPAHARRLRRLEDAFRDLLLSFADINLVGNTSTKESARMVANAIAGLAATRVPMNSADVEPIKLEMQPLLEVIGDHLKEFRLQARDDLDYERRPSRWRRILPWKRNAEARELAALAVPELPAPSSTD